MNIEQFKARFQNQKVNKVLDKELLKTSEELRQETEALKVMVASQGWKAVKKYLERSIELYKDCFLAINPANPIDTIRLQEGINVRKNLLSFIENKTK